MDELIYRQAAIDVLDVGAELLRRVLDDLDIVGIEREKYKWGLGLIEAYIDDMKELPSAQPERPKGYWIDTGSGQECSECGEVQYGYDNFRYYCAKCGSDNRGKCVMGRRMIYLDEAIDAIENVPDHGDVMIYEALYHAQRDVSLLPPAQPEIIRCLECKHYDSRPCGIVNWYNTADDFCSRAERKSDA